jgi:hypothetical protein
MPGMLAAGPAAVGASAGSVVAGAAGLLGAVIAGVPAAGGGFWPNEVSAKVREQRDAVSSFFIGWGKGVLPIQVLGGSSSIFPNGVAASRVKLFPFVIRRSLHASHHLLRINYVSGM